MRGLGMARPSSACGRAERAVANLQVGLAKHNWIGGRTKHLAGYLMVRMPDHPRARTQGYVFEHIIVMEAKLGRTLFADESVHHKNGIRDGRYRELT